MATRASLPILGQGSLRGMQPGSRPGSGSDLPSLPGPAQRSPTPSPAVPGQAPATVGNTGTQPGPGPSAGAPGTPATPTAPVSAAPASVASTAPAWVGGGGAEPMGFFTDTTICIGCKACEVACKSWNQLPATDGGVWELSGHSYDNTRRLDGIHWRHVKFVEQFPNAYDGRWLLMSDVCKHCVQAGCLEVCPTGAIVRTEFDTVVIQSDVCNGCRACIAACPFGVIDINPAAGTAQKCTLCYDRISVGLEPACSKACPTDSIQFGTIADLRKRAEKRVADLQLSGVHEAYLYGADPQGPLGGLNSFYLLVDKPEVYGLPAEPKLPSRNLERGAALSTAGAVAMAVLGMVGLRKRRMDGMAAESDEPASEGSFGPGPGPGPGPVSSPE